MWETVAPAATARAVAVVRVGCFDADGRPGGYTAYLHNLRSGGSFSAIGVGASTVTVAYTSGVLVGDLFQVSVGPRDFGLFGEENGHPRPRVWVEGVGVTFTDQVVASSAPTTLAPDPPAQLSAAGNGQLSVTWASGFLWGAGAVLTAVHWRWRVLGTESWSYVWDAAPTSPTVLAGVPNDIQVEVQGAATSDLGGLGDWGPSGVWVATGGATQTITLDTADGSAAYDPTLSLSGGVQTITLDTADGSGVYEPTAGFTAPSTIFLDTADLSVPLLDEFGQPILDEFGQPILTDSSGAFDPTVTDTGTGASLGFGFGFGQTFGI